MTQTTDPFETFRRLWGPLGLPMPGMSMPTLDPDEVAKRIADLRSIESWLSMNQNMVRMAISGLEVQKSALEAMRGGAPAGSGPGATAAGNPFADVSSQALTEAMLRPFALMQQAMAAAAPPADTPAPKNSKR